jgi:hypothetical protein
MSHNLPEGAKGFDCNTVVSSLVARMFCNAGFDFAVRYVPRTVRHSYDITVDEAKRIRDAGLSLMLVQHVALPGWIATAHVGKSYGSAAAAYAKVVGYPTGCVLWCDLEEVGNRNAAEIIGYCNAWYDQVKAAGYEPGLYVGYGCGLTPRELYYKLKFRRYWSAYNLNLDEYPAVRGVQMLQKPYPKPAARVNGVPFQYDENLVLPDFFGSTPVAWRPSITRED